MIHDPAAGMEVDISEGDAGVWKSVTESFREMHGDVWNRFWKGPMKALPPDALPLESGVLPASAEEIKGWWRTMAMQGAVQDQMRRALYPNDEVLPTPTDCFEMNYFARGGTGTIRVMFKQMGAEEQIRFRIEHKDLRELLSKAAADEEESSPTEEAEPSAERDSADWWK